MMSPRAPPDTWRRRSRRSPCNSKRSWKGNVGRSAAPGADALEACLGAGRSSSPRRGLFGRAVHETPSHTPAWKSGLPRVRGIEPKGSGVAKMASRSARRRALRAKASAWGSLVKLRDRRGGGARVRGELCSPHKTLSNRSEADARTHIVERQIGSADFHSSRGVDQQSEGGHGVARDRFLRAFSDENRTKYDSPRRLGWDCVGRESHRRFVFRGNDPIPIEQVNERGGGLRWALAASKANCDNDRFRSRDDGSPLELEWLPSNCAIPAWSPNGTSRQTSAELGVRSTRAIDPSPRAMGARESIHGTGIASNAAFALTA